MQDLYISISGNKIRASTVDPKQGLKTCEEALTDNVIEGSKILDVLTFTEVLNQCVSKLTRQPKNRLLLNFIIEPEDSVYRFFTLKKDDLADEATITNEIQAKLEKVKLGDLYYGYQKIAPFTYQFVGVYKETLERLLEISNNVGIGLKSAIPWVLVLPKYIDNPKPVVFVIKRENKQVIALSELNGIFFSSVNTKEISFEELSEFVNKIPTYNKNSHIDTIYTLGYDTYSLSGYQIEKLGLPIADLADESTKGYEVNILVNYALDEDPTLFSEQVNFINLLPLPEPVKKVSPMVYVVPVVVLLVGLGIYFGPRLIKVDNNGSATQLAMGQDEGKVLSETNTSTNGQSNQVSGSEQAKVDLKRADLKVKVYNGTGASGLAAKTKDFLTGLGYTVVGIDTADDLRKDTLYSFKKGKEVYKDLLVGDTKDKFSDVVVDTDLSEKEDYDLKIIIGGNANL